MQNFPRLATLFGSNIMEVTAPSIDSAIRQKIPESFDLDWKQALYRDTAELAKDVAAFANASGGVIIIGVSEKDGCADESKPVCLSDVEERRMRQAASHLRPFVTGMKIRALETREGHGYYLIVVPRSPDAPHAVIKGHGHVLSYPVRDETTTRWLAEPEIAARYRDRYLARSEVRTELSRVHVEGTSHLVADQRPWLAVSLVPSVRGHREVGASTLERTRQFLRSWGRCLPSTIAFGSLRTALTYVGVRRTIATEDFSFAGGASSHSRAEFHNNGSGFAAIELETIPIKQMIAIDRRCLPPEVDAIPQDALECHLLTFLSLLAHHAASTASGGECDIRAQLLRATRTESGEPTRANAIVMPTDRTLRKPVEEYKSIPNSFVLSRELATAEVTATLDDLVSGHSGIIRAAFALAADIVSDFGVAELQFLRPEGLISVDMLPHSRQLVWTTWATENGLTAPPTPRESHVE